MDLRRARDGQPAVARRLDAVRVFSARDAVAVGLRYKHWKKRISWPIWENRVLARAGCVHALNHAEAAMIRNVGVRTPICVVPNGVDVPECAPWKHVERRRLVYLGRLHPIKGLPELIKGWGQIPAKIRADWLLVLAGWDDSGKGDEYRALAAALAPDSIEFPGPAFGSDKDRLYSSARAFVLPSHSEGLPTAVLEAWSFGLPVVMTAACNLSVGFERGAAVQIEPDAESIAAVLGEFLTQSDERLEAMGRAGRLLVEDSFSWQRVAADMADVYQWILGGERPTSVILP